MVAEAWRSQVMSRLSNRARARYGAGRFIDVDTHAVFALPNPIHRDRCEDLRPEVESALADHFGWPVPLRLVADGDPGVPVGGTPAPPATESERGSAPRPEPDKPASAPGGDATEERDELDHIGDVDELDDADVASPGSVERITELFPGAEVVDDHQ